MYQQITIYWQSKCQTRNKFAKANNSYISFCEVTPKHFSFRSSVSDVIHKDLEPKCFGVTSQKPL